MNKNINDNFYIKMLDGAEHEFKRTDWPKLSQESETNLEKGLLSKETFKEILIGLGLTRLNNKHEKIPDSTKISEIEIPKCIESLKSGENFWQLPNLLGIKIHNDKAELRGNIFGTFTPSLMCVQSKSESVKRYFEKYCASDIKIFENDLEYETNLKSLKSQEPRECKAVFTCEMPDGTKEFEYSESFKNPIARVVKKEFITNFCNSKSIDPGSITKIKFFEGPRKFWHNSFNDLSNLKELEIPEGTYYLLLASLSTEEQLDSLILPSSLVTLYNKYGEVYDPFGGCDAPKNVLIKNNDNTRYNNKYKEFIQLHYPETKIFDNEKEFYRYEELHDDKLFIKIKDTNGKIYERELKFGNYKIYDSRNGSGTCSSEDKYLAEEMLIDILKDLGLEKKQVSEIEIPYGVKSLGYRSFMDYINLKSITLPNSLEQICDYAFHGCYDLKKLYIPKSVKWVGLDAIGFCKNLKKLVINENAKLNKFALAGGDESLFEIIIIENPEAEEAVNHAIKMKAVPENAKIFRSMEGYDKYFETKKYPIKIVDVNEKTYESEITLGKEKTLTQDSVENLLKDLGLKREDVLSFEIPDGTEIIGQQAFCGFENMKEIYMPDSVKRICKGAFYLCKSLEELYIPENVDEVEDNALINCLKLKNLILNNKTKVKHTVFGVNHSLSQITIIKDSSCKNSNTEKEIEKAIEMELISKDAKIFYGELGPEIKDDQTHIEKYRPEKNKSYSELIDLKSLTLIWLIYKFIVITVYKFKHNILKLEDGKQNKNEFENQSKIKKNNIGVSKKGSFSEKIKLANHKIASKNKNNILKREKKKSSKVM